eukprot:6899498-Prymnesium_polylepis.1
MPASRDLGGPAAPGSREKEGALARPNQKQRLPGVRGLLCQSIQRRSTATCSGRGGELYADFHSRRRRKGAQLD